MRLWPSIARLQMLSKPDLVRICAFTLAIWGPIYAPILWYMGQPSLGLLALGAAIAVALIGWYQTSTSSTLLTSNLLVAILYVTITVIWYSYRGDLLSHWILTVPVIATMLGTPRMGVFWTSVYLLHMLVLQPSGLLPAPPLLTLSLERVKLLEVVGTSGVAIFLLSIVTLYERFRNRATAAIEAKNQALQQAVREVQWLQEILPICMHCRRVRNEGTSWQRLDEYLDSHSELRFSHGLCEDCLREHYPKSPGSSGSDS